MKMEGAIVTEQGVTFAIVVVKKSAMQTDNAANQLRQSLKNEITDFATIPVVLASQDAAGRFEYHGRKDIVNFLANIDPARIPWREYTL